MKVFKKYKFVLNLVGSTLALLTPVILLTSCAKEEKVPETFKDLKKEPFSVLIKQTDLQNTEFDGKELQGADKSDVMINVADNKLVLRKPFSETEIDTLRKFIASFRDKKSHERYTFDFFSTNQDAKNDWKSTINENQIYLWEEKTIEETTFKTLSIIFRSAEYQNFNNLFTINNNKLKIDKYNPLSNANITAYGSIDHQNNPIGFLTRSGQSPVKIDELSRSIVFENLVINKIVITNKAKNEGLLNWTANLGKFTLLNAF
ncbi:hypothetical protein [[Mycoplasma] imitans]|uniref:hypothetical protein n=1 Tax=[Mycoplasma] imitans TaxID=29560 RepID=UPI0004803E0F|nr:hypothetical protein [[Mycoplasma] imitans]